MKINSASSYKTTNRKKVRHFSWRGSNFFLISACLVFGTMYLVGMNDLTVKSFVLQDLKSHSTKLSAENQDLQAQALALQSYDSIAPRLQTLNMVPVENIAYISSQASTLARR